MVNIYPSEAKTHFVQQEILCVRFLHCACKYCHYFLLPQGTGKHSMLDDVQEVRKIMRVTFTKDCNFLL